MILRSLGLPFSMSQRAIEQPFSRVRPRELVRPRATDRPEISVTSILAPISRVPGMADAYTYSICPERTGLLATTTLLLPARGNKAPTESAGFG